MKRVLMFILAVLCLSGFICQAEYGMPLSLDTTHAECDLLQNLPKVKIEAPENQKSKSRNVSLREYLDFMPYRYRHGNCPNAIILLTLLTAMSIEMNQQLGTFDMISPQFVNSCFSRINPNNFNCCDNEGGPYDFVYLLDFFKAAESIVLTSNQNAQWQDYDGACSVSCKSISTDPLYTVDLPGQSLHVIDTSENPVAAIEAVLDEGRALPVFYFFPSDTAFSILIDHYEQEDEESILDFTSITNLPLGNYQATSLCIVGYDDQAWECLIPFGGLPNRPNCVIRIGKDYDYELSYTIGGEQIPLNTIFDIQGAIYEVYEPRYLSGSSIFVNAQYAIDSAPYFGGKAILADGIFSGLGYHDIDYGGKDFTLTSENGPENCILDGLGESRLFHFHNNETGNAIVDGITISNGFARDQGGGILIEDARPTIKNCLITSCRAEADNEDLDSGGGIATINSHAYIQDCQITYCLADQGGGLFIENGTPRILNTTISGNSGGTGGGIFLLDTYAVISRCTIRDNYSYIGAGIFSEEAIFSLSYTTIDENGIWFIEEAENRGSGIHLFRSDAYIRCNFIMRNRGGSGIQCVQSSPLIEFGNYIAFNKNNLLRGDGGGITCDEGAPRIYDNLIYKNEAHKGAGIYTINSDAVINDNIIWENDALASVSYPPPISTDYDGGGVYICNNFLSNARVRLSNNLIIDNTAERGGGLFLLADDSEIWSCTISDNESSDSSGMEIEMASSNVELNYCIMQPGTNIIDGGTLNSCNLNTFILPISNINEDPLFTNVPWLGRHFLSQSPEGIDNPSVDYGDVLANNVCYESTRNSNRCQSTGATSSARVGDSGILDMGFHYHPAISIESPPVKSLSAENPYTKPQMFRNCAILHYLDRVNN
ncbi:hypothetical protein ACFL2B_02865 [Patescibacteria group bacterium]